MTKVIADKTARSSEHSQLALEEYMVTPEEIVFFEDFQDITRSLSRTQSSPEPINLNSAEALTGWGYDVAERLNSGELNLQTLKQQFLIDIAEADVLQFHPVGEYELRLERDDLNHPWQEHIKHLMPATAAQHPRRLTPRTPHTRKSRPPDR